MEGVLLAVAAVIVTYNSEQVIEACLGALAEMAPEACALVIDNASADATVERSRGVEIVVNTENRGFAAAVNQGFRATAGECVLLLNPDVRLRSGIGPMVQACLDNGLAAGLLTDDAGRPQRGFSIRRLPTPTALAFELLGLNRLWPSNPVNRRYRCADLDLERAGPVEQPAGAFLMIRRDVWERLGGFDEAFHPIWFEDVDFCRRAIQAGYGIEYVPWVRAAHSGGHSVGQVSLGCRTKVWYASLLKYAAKHFRTTGYRAVCLAAVASTVPRMVAGMILERSLTPIPTFLDILSFAGRRLVSHARAAERPGQDAR